MIEKVSAITLLQDNVPYEVPGSKIFAKKFTDDVLHGKPLSDGDWIDIDYLESIGKTVLLEEEYQQMVHLMGSNIMPALHKSYSSDVAHINSVEEFFSEMNKVSKLLLQLNILTRKIKPNEVAIISHSKIDPKFLEGMVEGVSEHFGKKLEYNSIKVGSNMELRIWWN